MKLNAHAISGNVLVQVADWVETVTAGSNEFMKDNYLSNTSTCYPDISSMPRHERWCVRAGTDAALSLGMRLCRYRSGSASDSELITTIMEFDSDLMNIAATNESTFA